MTSRKTEITIAKISHIGTATTSSTRLRRRRESRTRFAVPGAGTYGDHEARSITGPGYWNVDLALARLLPVGDQRTFEIRIETFNLFNNFNWGDPVTNLDSPQFGRITTQNGSPRIMQFALKYGF